MTAITDHGSPLRIFEGGLFDMGGALAEAFPGRHRACRIAQAGGISPRAAQMLLARQSDPSGRTLLALMCANPVFAGLVMTYVGGWCDAEMVRLNARSAVTHERRAARRGRA